MADDSTSAIYPEIYNSNSAIFLGACFGFMLYGLLVQQCWRYFKIYSKDHWLLKSTVWVLLFLETVHAAFTIHIGYDYLIQNYNNESAYARGSVTIALLVPVVGGVVMISNCYYARRVYLLKPSFYKLFFITWGVLMGPAIGFSIAATVKLVVDTSFVNWLRVKWMITVCFACIGASDIVVSAVLVVYLYKQRTGFKRTDQMLDMLIAYAFNTGLVTSTSSFSCMILSLVEGRNLYVIAFSMIAAKIYANSVLITMNSREQLRLSRRRMVGTSSDGSDIYTMSTIRFQRSRAVSGSQV